MPIGPASTSPKRGIPTGGGMTMAGRNLRGVRECAPMRQASGRPRVDLGPSELDQIASGPWAWMPLAQAIGGYGGTFALKDCDTSFAMGRTRRGTFGTRAEVRSPATALACAHRRDAVSAADRHAAHPRPRPGALITSGTRLLPHRNRRHQEAMDEPAAGTPLGQIIEF